MTSHGKRSSSRRKAKSHAPQRQAGSDAAVYLGLIMIGAFAIALFWLLLKVNWTHGLVGYLIAMAVLINLYAWQAFLGKTLPNWQQALARVPMRIAGYGTRGGKPLAAAKGQPDAKMTLMLFGAGCVVVIAIVTVLII